MSEKVSSQHKVDDTYGNISIMKFICAALVITAIQVLFALVVIVVFPDWSSRGTFGDMFGGINALFTGLAFAGVIYTILLQRHEIHIARLQAREDRESQLEQIRLAQLSTRLETTVVLRDHYQTLLGNIPTFVTGSEEEKKYREYKASLEHLEADLLRVRNELIGPIQVSGEAINQGQTVSGEVVAGS